MLSKLRFPWPAKLDLPFFLAAVPAICAAFYFAFLASDVYTSESRFVIRSPEQPRITGLGSLLQGAGFSKAADDSFSVREYINSRDALHAVDQRLRLKSAFSSKTIDVFSRFAGLDPDDSFEALHRYYQGMVDVQTDSSSSIITLNVKAFTPIDAVSANRILLEQSEELVNRLNERGRQDLIRYAQNEVAAAEAKAKDAALALSKYRNSENVVDPEKQATVQLQQIAKLQDELIATATQLSQLRTFTPSNPQIPVLINRSETLKTEIAKETSRVAGGQSSLANKAAQFQRLALDAEFANKQLASALASLENARNEALRKQVYLERIAEPSTPDAPHEPRRVRAVIGTLIIGLVAWGVLTILLAGVREHTE